MQDLKAFCVKATAAGKLVLVAALDGTFQQEVREPWHKSTQQQRLHLPPPATALHSLSEMCALSFQRQRVS